jgi:hypothetical protein
MLVVEYNLAEMDLWHMLVADYSPEAKDLSRRFLADQLDHNPAMSDRRRSLAAAQLNSR